MRRKELGIDRGRKTHSRRDERRCETKRESKCHHSREMKREGKRRRGSAWIQGKRGGGKTLPRGSREMNHIIMNNNMPCPWYSLCLVINSNDLAGDFASIVGGCVSRETRTTTLHDSPQTNPNTHRFPKYTCIYGQQYTYPCRHVPRFLRYSIYLHYHVHTLYVVKKKNIKYFAIPYCGSHRECSVHWFWLL